MSHFESRLNQRFWRSKKIVQVVQIGGKGAGGGDLDEIQKIAAFSWDVVPNNIKQLIHQASNIKTLLKPDIRI